MEELWGQQGLWANDFPCPRAVKQLIAENPRLAQDLAGRPDVRCEQHMLPPLFIYIYIMPAGNSFSMTTCQVELIASFCHCKGWGTLPKQQQGQPPVPLPDLQPAPTVQAKTTHRICSDPVMCWCVVCVCVCVCVYARCNCDVPASVLTGTSGARDSQFEEDAFQGASRVGFAGTRPQESQGQRVFHARYIYIYIDIYIYSDGLALGIHLEYGKKGLPI